MKILTLLNAAYTTNRAKVVCSLLVNALTSNEDAFWYPLLLVSY